VLRLFDCLPATVTAISPRFGDETGAPDVVMATLQFPGGQVARIDVSTLEPDVRHETVVVCDDRTLVFDEFNPRAPLQIIAPARRFAPSPGNAWHETVAEHPAAHAAELSMLVADAYCTAVRSRDVNASNAAVLAAAAEVWQAARASIQREGEPVEVQPAIDERERPQLRVIAGGGHGDGVSAAALKLVPQRPPVEAPLSSA
jgi:hypothetical protein